MSKSSPTMPLHCNQCKAIHKVGELIKKADSLGVKDLRCPKCGHLIATLNN